MPAPNSRRNDHSWAAQRVALLAFPLFALGSLAARTIVAQDIREPGPEGVPVAATATRLIPLYYVRDAEKVIATVRGPVEDRATIERERTLLDRQEQALRAEDFRDQAQSATAGRLPHSEARESPRAVDQVRITVLGEGQLHLRGPLEGVNAIARMIHEIDQPVGQVKLGIHVVQFTGQEDSACEGAPGLVDRYLAHARQMSDVAIAVPSRDERGGGPLLFDGSERL